MNKLESTKILNFSKKFKAVEYLGGCCIVCKESNILKLTFHHKNKKDKSFKIADYRTYRFSTILKELDKCVVLCYNCHAEEHYYNSNNLNDFRRENKLIYLEYSLSYCIECGYNKCPGALSFHHIDPKLKLFSMSELHKPVLSLNELNNIIKKEIDKCDVLCMNCHLSKHNDIEFYEKYKSDIEKKIINYKEKQSKIDRDDVYRMYDNGLKQILIAKHFNASKGTISDIIKNR